MLTKLLQRSNNKFSVPAWEINLSGIWVQELTSDQLFECKIVPRSPTIRALLVSIIIHLLRLTSPILLITFREPSLQFSPSIVVEIKLSPIAIACVSSNTQISL